MFILLFFFFLSSHNVYLTFFIFYHLNAVSSIIIVLYWSCNALELLFFYLQCSFSGSVLLRCSFIILIYFIFPNHWTPIIFYLYFYYLSYVSNFFAVHIIFQVLCRWRVHLSILFSYFISPNLWTPNFWSTVHFYYLIYVSTTLKTSRVSHFSRYQCTRY